MNNTQKQREILKHHIYRIAKGQAHQCPPSFVAIGSHPAHCGQRQTHSSTHSTHDTHVKSVHTIEACVVSARTGTHKSQIEKDPP